MIGTGLAKGAHARGKRIAFGDGRQIFWSTWCKDIFRNNPNIAPPGSERARDVEWLAHYKGNRVYVKAGSAGWIWNYDFRAIPGEFYFGGDELGFEIKSDFIYIEPHLKKVKKGLQNKDWGFANYQAVVDRMPGVKFVQSDWDKRQILQGAKSIRTHSFRHAVALLRKAKLYIGPEGGLHHAAAALGIPAVVIFGGWIPPKVLGYDNHVSLTGGATQWCGSWSTCEHCRQALNNISADEVADNARRLLQ